MKKKAINCLSRIDLDATRMLESHPLKAWIALSLRISGSDTSLGKTHIPQPPIPAFIILQKHPDDINISSGRT